MSQSRPDNVVPLRVPVPVASVQGTLALDLQPRQEPPRVLRGWTSGATATSRRWAHRFAQAARRDRRRRPSRDAARCAGRPVRSTATCSGGHCSSPAPAATRPGVARVQPVRPQVLSVRACFLDRGVVEAGVHVRYGERSRAVAARFELRRGRHDPAPRWVCTALEFA